MDRADAEEGELSVRRLFSPALPAQGHELELSADAAEHARVLRLGEGDAVELFDGQGGRAEARVVRVAKRSLRCAVERLLPIAPRDAKVVLVQCVPKGRKLDDIVRMTTELGVSAVHLAWSERCVSRAHGDRDAHKLERLTRIAVEAARQSEQAYIPELRAPARLADVLARAPRDALKLAMLERGSAPLPLTLATEEVWLVVGPEGGLAESDRAALASACFEGVSFGRAILRTETAAVVGVAVVADRLRKRG